MRGKDGDSERKGDREKLRETEWEREIALTQQSLKRGTHLKLTYYRNLQSTKETKSICVHFKNKENNCNKSQIQIFYKWSHTVFVWIYFT